MAVKWPRALALALAALAVTLGYLRDPEWLLRTTQGFEARETEGTGRAFRWMGGHASFFVPSDAASVEIPVAAPFDSPGDSAVEATITIDGRPAERFELTDDAWRTISLRLPSGGSRRVRRLDMRVDRTRRGNRGLKVGDVRIRFPSQEK